MDRRVKKHYHSVILSCLLFEATFADIPCQEGITYQNSCNPYKVSFIHYTQSKENSYVLESKNNKKKKRGWFSRSYLNALLDKYSSNYDGRSGLQALIDRSNYEKPIKVEKQEKNSSQKVEKSTSLAMTQKAVTSFEQNQTALVTEESTPQLQKEEQPLSKKSPPLQSSLVKNQSKHTEKKVVVAQNKKEEKSHENFPYKKKHATLSNGIKKQKPTVAYYTIQKGDTLSAIATKLGLSIKQLKALNKIGKNATIKAGEKLAVPAKLLAKLIKQKTLHVVQQKKKKALLAKKQKHQEMLKKGIYIVQKGDTLSSIARKSNLSINQLREFNRIARSSRIKVGQKLFLQEPKVAKSKRGSLNYVKNIKFKHAPSLKFKRKIRVIATAYTSHRNQTDSTPFLAAWNNRIRPGMKIIAVSEDLIRKYGLKNGVKVKITGLPGYYVVRDKMNKRLRNHIDIYMGINKRRALRWGRRRVALYW